MNELKYLYYWNKKNLSKKNESSTNMDVTIWTKLIEFKSLFLAGGLKPYRQMFTKYRWNVLNITRHPVDDHSAITTTLMRFSPIHYFLFHERSGSQTFLSRYPNQGSDYVLFTLNISQIALII